MYFCSSSISIVFWIPRVTQNVPNERGEHTEPASHKLRTTFLLGKKKVDVAKLSPKMFAKMESYWQYTAMTISPHIHQLWTFVYKSLCGHTLSLLLGKFLGVEWLVHIIDMVNFLRNRHTVSKVVVTFTLPPAVYEFQLLHILINICHDQSFKSVFLMCSGISFWYFPNDQWCWGSFIRLFVIHVSSLVKCLFRSFAYFFKLSC